MSATLATSPGLRFYREVAKCVPFLMEQFELAELTSKHALRRAIAARFLAHKDLKNADATDIMIYKGRQELEINQWVTDPAESKRHAAMKVERGFSPFLESFLEGNYTAAKRTYQ